MRQENSNLPSIHDLLQSAEQISEGYGRVVEATIFAGSLALTGVAGMLRAGKTVNDLVAAGKELIK